MMNKSTCAALLYDALLNYVANVCNFTLLTFEYNDSDRKGICNIVVQNAGGVTMVCDITEILSAFYEGDLVALNVKIKKLKAVLKAFGEK